MSAQQAKSSDSKSKSKFQSLNINTVFQGAANKSTSKNLPPKHGLQSLGKVPTARRAPVSLPSEKSEKGGNDPSVVLVPTGGGWASKDGDKKTAGEPVKPERSGVGDQVNTQAPGEQGARGQTHKQGTPPGATSNKGGPKLWSSVTGAGSPGQEISARQKKFLHQKSPLFGQEFPSLPGDAPAGSPGARESTSHTEMDRSQQEAGPMDPAYGPGPNLRPQTFGTWSQGGAAGGSSGKNGGLLQEGEDALPILPPQPHKPQPPPSQSGKTGATTQFKSIMPGFMDALELPTGPPTQHGGKRPPPRHHGDRGRNSRDRDRPRPDTTAFTNHSIIDKEKLQRMDDLDNGNDWTYEDDDFDYNKKLESDDDDASDQVASSSMADPNWADQVHGGQQPGKGSPHYNFYDDFKSKPVVGFDDEDRRRNKKSEEVMKNIERARQRREEEENRYRQHPREGEQQQQRDGGGHYRENYRETGAQRTSGAGREQQRGFDDRQFDARSGDRAYYESYRDSEAGYKSRGGRGYEREDDRSQGRHSGGWDRGQGYGYGDREVSPAVGNYNRHDSEVSATESIEDRKNITAGSASPEWGVGNTRRIQDWVEDVEEGDSREEREAVGERKGDTAGENKGDHDRPSRPNSRDSRVSKESRGSKGSRASRDRETGFGMKKDENKMGKFYGDNDKKQKNSKQSPMTDIRGYFRDDGGDQEKKQFRHAPGPITKEKLESFEMKESMTQLKKRDAKIEEKKDCVKADKPESTNVLSSLLDSDLLENISEDDDIFDNDEEEKPQELMNNRGRGAVRGRGRGIEKDTRQFGGRGGKVERPERGGGRAGRGGRGDGKRGGGGGHKVWGEPEEITEAEEKTKKPEALMANPQQNPSGFMPRGQPSRRGRGEGRVRQSTGLGRQKPGEFGGQEEIGDWSEAPGDKSKTRPPRSQKGKKDGLRPGSGGGEDVEEWETASETSLEEREKRGKIGKDAMVRGRGGRGGGRGANNGGWPGMGDISGGKQASRKQGPGNAGSGSHHGLVGSASEATAEDSAEATNMSRGPGMENFDLNDYSSAHVMEDSHWGAPDPGAEADFEHEAEGFSQVVNNKMRGGMSMAGPPPHMRGSDRRGADRGMMDKKQNNKNTFDRRQSKLPPRLAKQREVAKAQARTGPGLSPSPGTENGWPEGDKMGVFNVDTGTGAWEKPLDGVALGHGSGNTENGSIQQTIIFENTAYKGGKGDKMDKAGPIQLPLSFAKQDTDNGDLKLDFTFGGEAGPGQPPLSIPKSLTSGGLPASPSTDDLQTKLANTKKLWDAPGMAAVPENSATGSWNEADLYGGSGDGNTVDPGDKSNGDREAGAGSSPHGPGVSNIAKVKPQQQMTIDGDGRPGGAAHHYSRMAVPSPPGSHSLPPSQLAPLQPWAFLSDASRTSPMYNPYSPLNQSILMPGVTGHNLNTDLFNSHNTLRGVPTFQGSGLTTTPQLMSQANLINSQAAKLGSGIGPIGTKAGAGGPPGPNSPYLTNLPNTNSNIFIQYDNSGNPLNYMPGSAPPGRGNPPSQTAFYQSIAAANRQQAYNALASAQMRANAVAGMPFKMSDQAKSPVSINDTGFNTTAVPPYNGRATNAPPGPPSPKTKLKIAQQQEQAKLTASMNNLNINNLNALAQMQRSMQLGQHFNNLSGLVQQQQTVAGAGQYNPSPIARPQVSHSQGAMMSGGQLSKQMNQYFNQDGTEAAKYDASEETLAADKVDGEGAGEELCEAVSDTPSQPAEQEAGVAN